MSFKEFDIDDSPQYWLMPPNLYDELDGEFHFDFDPCPYPKSFDGLNCEWGKMNFVNPPFKKKDGSPTAFVRKAIKEQALGKSSVIVLPTPSYVNLMLEAGAEVKSMGRIIWISGKDGSAYKNPSPITLFHLRGKT